MLFWFCISTLRCYSGSVSVHSDVILVLYQYTQMLFWFCISTRRCYSGSVSVHADVILVLYQYTQMLFWFCISTRRCYSGSVSVHADVILVLYQYTQMLFWFCISTRRCYSGSGGKMRSNLLSTTIFWLCNLIDFFQYCWYYLYFTCIISSYFRGWNFLNIFYMESTTNCTIHIAPTTT